jgi:dipeptidyl aminopeptidase/acylaminoacyl peptidase
MQEKVVISKDGQIKPKKSSKIWFIIGTLILFLAGFSVYYLPGNKNNKNSSDSAISKLSSIIVSPTPIPFVELTIPYLRNKTYAGKLGELVVESESQNYTSYLTSYTSDSFRVNGLLTKPSGAVPAGGWPAIVFVHGYIPPAQYDTRTQYADYVNYLARNGFVVFKIDLRGHGNSEGQAGGGYFGADYIADVLNARAALLGSDFVNPNAIGLWGHSMAGNVLLRSFAVKPEIPAVVIWAGAVYSYEDRERYGISDASFQPSANPTGIGRRQRITEAHGEASSGSAFWKEMAPTNFLKDLKGAIEIHHAVNDTVVNVGYSRDLMKLLDETSVPHELHEYQSGGHNITGAAFNTAMQRTVSFFKKYLQ